MKINFFFQFNFKGYALKQRNYDPSVDDLMVIDYDVLITDDPGSVHGAVLTPRIDLGAITFATTSVTISRTATEQPNIALTSSILNQTNVPFTSKY